MKDLIDIVDSTYLTGFHLFKARQIDAEDYSPVAKKVRKDIVTRVGAATREPLDGHVERGVLALKAYYFVALVDPFNEHAVSGPIDPFWETHVLFTKRYAAFCERVFGGYVHHEPLDQDDVVEVARVLDLYVYTQEVYGSILRELDTEFFPREIHPSQLVCRHMSVEDPTIRANAAFGLAA